MLHCDTRLVCIDDALRRYGEIMVHTSLNVKLSPLRSTVDDDDDDIVEVDDCAVSESHTID